MGGREGSHMKTEAEAGGTTPQAKECQGPPETGQGKEGSSSRALGGITALATS